MIPVKLYFISKSHMATTNIDYNTIPRAAKSPGVQAQFRQLVSASFASWSSSERLMNLRGITGAVRSAGRGRRRERRC